MNLQNHLEHCSWMKLFIFEALYSIIKYEYLHVSDFYWTVMNFYNLSDLKKPFPSNPEINVINGYNSQKISFFIEFCKKSFKPTWFFLFCVTCGYSNGFSVPFLGIFCYRHHESCHIWKIIIWKINENWYESFDIFDKLHTYIECSRTG